MLLILRQQVKEKDKEHCSEKKWAAQNGLSWLTWKKNQFLEQLGFSSRNQKYISLEGDQNVISQKVSADVDKVGEVVGLEFLFKGI